VLRAHAERDQHPNAPQLALRAAELCRQRAEAALRAMWHNEDARKYRFAQELLAGDYAWLERGVMSLPYSVDELRPRGMDEFFKARAERPRSERAPRSLAS
jgi:hypothetical protein